MELFGIRSSFSRRSFVGHGGYLEICKIAYPLVIMSATNSIMQFVDRKFLAENSTLDVAASMPGGILYFTLFAFFLATCNYTSALVAQYHGANDRSNLLRAVWAGQTLAVFAGLVITFVIPPIGIFFIERSGHPTELLSREIEYFTSLLPSGVFICMAAPYFAFFSGQGRTIPVAVINIGACLLNIFLDYIFIFGKLGLPAYGIFGAGIATSICCMALMIAVMVYFYSQNQRKIPTRKRWEFRPELLMKLVRFGAPAGFQTFIDVGAWTMVTFMIGNLGPAALAASVIALSINNIFFVPLMGLSDSTAIVVGQYIGRNRHGIAQNATYRAWRLSAVYAFLGALIYAGDSVKFVFMGAMRGAGDTIAIFLLNSLTAWGLLVPGVVLLTQVFKSSIYMVWGFVACVCLVDAMIFLWRFNTGKWRRIKLIEKKDNRIPLEELARENP